MFYIGSALRFFDKEGRLNDYFMPGRVSSSLAKSGGKVSKDIAGAIHNYSIEQFVLIIPQEFDIQGLTKDILVSAEQLWMLLYPTFNRSLMASSNDGKPMTEEDRQRISTSIFQYELVNGLFVGPTILFGIKEQTRKGIISLAGINTPIEYNTLKGCMDNLMI